MKNIFQGFATFSEDHIHTRAMQTLGTKNLSEISNSFPEFVRLTRQGSKFFEEVSDLRSRVRYLTLTSELENTSEDLQVWIDQCDS